VKTTEEHPRKIISTNQKNGEERLSFLVMGKAESTDETTGTTLTSEVFRRERPLSCDLLLVLLGKE
jgi:hypothetical protein